MDDRDRYVYACTADLAGNGEPLALNGHEKSFAEVVVIPTQKTGIFRAQPYEVTRVTGVIGHDNHLDIDVSTRIIGGLLRAPLYGKRIELAHWRAKRHILGSKALEAAISSEKSPEVPTRIPAKPRSDALV
jgi:hypothetical protein